MPHKVIIVRIREKSPPVWPEEGESNHSDISSEISPQQKPIQQSKRLRQSFIQLGEKKITQFLPTLALLTYLQKGERKLRSICEDSGAQTLQKTDILS